jgi:oligopeptide/dipeptide ABC transporter ATP-binding protein
VTIQAQILELLRKLQRERGMSILLITHDLGVVAENADVVGVMYASRVVEFATVEDLFDRPQHPYTEGLFKSVPKLGHTHARLDTITGSVPNPAKFPVGCKFHPRCHRTRQVAATAPPQDTEEIVTEDKERFRVMTVCRQNEPVLKEVSKGHWASCHFTENYANAPVTKPTLTHRRDVVTEAIVGADTREPLVAIPVKEEFKQ